MLMRVGRWACAVTVRTPETPGLWFLGQCSSYFHLTLHRMLYCTITHELMLQALGDFLNFGILEVRLPGYLVITLTQSC